jgi:sulfite reductase alpha subunit-like flavoprotein
MGEITKYYGLATFTVAALVTMSLLQHIRNKKLLSLTFPETSNEAIKKVSTDSTEITDSTESGRVCIVYATTTGTAKNFSETLQRHIQKKCPVSVEVWNLSQYNEESLSKEDVVLFIVSTWENGVAPQTAVGFSDWLNDLAFDFRVSKDYLANLKFAVFGLGGAIYGTNYAKFVSYFLNLLKFMC